MCSYLSMMEAKLPPGFRFHPRDDELICDYLSAKVSGAGGGGGGGRSWPLMLDVDLNQCEPWDLPEKACVGGKEWYFFNLRDKKYATGQRTNRATQSGYWKATGKDRRVVRKGVAVGSRKTLVFYQGRAPKGKKTDWVMHEFRRLEGGAGDDDDARRVKFSCKVMNALVSKQEDWVLCRVFFKSRGISVKPTMEKPYNNNNNNNSSSSSSSLPPLMDTYASFEQNPKSILGFGQVPCFSNYQQSNHPSQPMHGKCLANLGGLPEPPFNLNPPNSYDDKNAIKTILDQLNKLEGSNPRREMDPNLTQLSYESYLFDVGFPSMWNPN